MAVKLPQLTMVAFPNGALFAVTNLDGMEARPADMMEHAPKAFAYTGYRNVTMTVPITGMDAAYAITERYGLQPCALIRGDERYELAFASQTLTTILGDLGKVRCSIEGMLYDKAADGAPVTDKAMIAWLTEKYKPHEYTAEEIAETERLDAMYESMEW